MGRDKNRFLQRFLVALVLFVVTMGLLGYCVFSVFAPDHYFKAYPLIPFFFFFFGLAFMAIIHFIQKGDNLSTKSLMASKGVKMVGSIFIILLYFILAKTKLVEFAFTYMAFYFAYLIFESVALTKYTKGENNSLQQTE